MTISAEPVEPRPAAPVRPTAAFMWPRLSRWIALGFGSGLSPWAPGTIGTLWAWAAWEVLSGWMSVPVLLWLVAAGFLVGIWACGRTADALGVADHGGIVWDEIVAFWLVLAFAPPGFGAQFAAFLLFRLFDITKPPPIRQIDARVPGGFGVMLDDLLAAFYTLLVLALWRVW
ncbi:MAG: Phosphatidylglycerophosphatase [Pseudomonadota bacterium]|jgi:phosphatidylglycerophosphatase A